MGFIKCPRCELNYIQEGEQYCSVCKREMKGELKDDPYELCSVCNENPALPGKDMCLFCLKEMGKVSDETPDAEEGEEVAAGAELELEDVSMMDEITPDIATDIPDRELGEIDRELSLEETAEEEEESARREEDEEEPV
ncbi:hypothetical protein [Beduinella massiliensis]|uniref:hypothetical protein n=1 Tax=Beduinella massiliensis TaxID=1852363 RepID=UPI000C858113